MIKGVAFDMEGTVVNVEPAHHWGWIHAATEIGVKLDSPENAIEKVANFSGGPDAAIIEQIFALAGIKPTSEQMIAFLASKWRHYDQLVEQIDLRPRDGFFEAYGKLKCAGIPMTIGTAVDLDKGLALLKRSGLAKFFLLHEIVLLTDVKNPKPAADCFLETASRMMISPINQLVFEDSPRGVKSGFAAGSFVVGIPVYNNDIVKLRLTEAGASVIYTNWHAISDDIDALLAQT